MNYWFVNLKKYKIQREGCFLWAPLYNQSGGTNKYWETLKEVNRGDIILCNHKGQIISIAIAKTSAYIHNIPKEFNQEWNQKGRKIDLFFIDLNIPLKYKDYKNYIQDNIDPYKNPFDIKGNAKVGYLFPIDKKIAKYLLNKINNKKTADLLMFTENEIQNEIEEKKEEQEQFEKINNGSIIGYTMKELKELENKKYHFHQRTETNKSRNIREKTDIKLKATRLELANHLCEINCHHKTFTNTTGKYQYLECHHLIPMNAQKDFPNIKLDSLFNLIALCPICHSQVHYALKEEKKEIFLKMYELRKKEMLDHGFNTTIINKIFTKYYL